MAFFGNRPLSGRVPEPFIKHARADGEDSAAGSGTSGPTVSPEMEAAMKTRIIAQPSATNLNECRFMVGATLQEGRLVRISGPEQAEHSPLARRLFEVPQVRSVSFVGNVVTVVKEGDDPWQEVARKIGTAIRMHLASGLPAVEEEFWASQSGDVSDDELFGRVQDVINTLINPGVAGHGGFVRLLGVEKDTAYVQLGGGCHGCGMATFTLKQGVEKTILQHVPEIKHVEDATDHSSGVNPYYAP